MRIVAILLIVLGIAGLIHRGFTVTTDEEQVALGPVTMHVEKREHVAVPVWAGVALILAGAGLLLYVAGRPAAR